VLLAAGVLLAGAALVGVYAYLRPTVTVTEVVEGPVVEAFYATGTLEPDREYPVRATGGGIVQKPATTRPYVDKGDHVAEGQPLAVVADAQWQAAYDRAKAELGEKRKRADEKSSPVLAEYDAKVRATAEQLEIARREQDRIIRLLETGGTTPTEFDQAMNRVHAMTMDQESFKAQREQAKLALQKDLDVAEAALKAAEWNLGQQTLRSPVAGVVLDRPVPPGTRLGVNDHVLQIADVRPEKLVMRAQVDEEDVTKVRPGQTVRMILYSFPGEPFEGKVTRIYDKADPDRRTFEVDVTPNKPDGKFAAGMTGELAFEVKNKPRALIVPSQAVQDGRLYLLRGGRLKALDAAVGVKGVEKAEIVSGVKPGDRVLITPAAGLRDGQSVRARFMDPVAAAALNKPKEKEIFRGGF
jgi:multidrug efflux pump subunit AcrA (membrane-fusion protein)